MPDGAAFNGTQNVLPPDYFRTLEIGQVLDDEAQNPLVYSRRRDAPAWVLSHNPDTADTLAVALGVSACG